MAILTSIATVEQLRYRTARTIPMIRIKRDTEEGCKFERELSERAGKDIDNHVVYIITLNGQKLYVMCSDDHISIGTELIVENW